jgi:hypothetical protein
MLVEPARMTSVSGVVDRWWRHHEVSIAIAAVADAGWCLGWQPRAKVSMMIMRPPQQRHGRGNTRGCVTRRAIATWPFLKSEPRNQVRADSPLEGDGFELLLKIQPKENCGFPGLAIRTIVPQTGAK